MLSLAYGLTGSIPAAEIQIDSEATLGIVKQGEYAFPTPAIPEMGAVWAAMDAAVANIWNGADIKKELDAATEVILNQ
jgi:arabinogalactan oligomer/maltooligosaccharide transport system substrate-binding protein